MIKYIKKVISSYLDLDWIKQLLDETATELAETQHRLSQAETDIYNFKKVLDETATELAETQHRLSQAETDIENFKKLLDIGVDVYDGGGSWAVICLKGKRDYIKFVCLKEASIREIQYFLSQFRGADLRIDGSSFIKYYLSNEYLW